MAENGRKLAETAVLKWRWTQAQVAKEIAEAQVALWVGRQDAASAPEDAASAPKLQAKPN